MRVLTRVRLDPTYRIGIRRLRGAWAARAVALVLAVKAHGGEQRRTSRTWPKTAVRCRFQARAARGEHGRYEECIYRLGLARRGPEGGARWQRGHGASSRNRACGKEGKRASDAPYRNEELLGHLLDDGKRWSGGASGSQGAASAGLRG
jgi:hypothetical protein